MANAKEKNFWTYLGVLIVVPGTFWDWVQKQKTNFDFERIFDNQNISFSTTFMTVLTLFQAIYQSQSKHRRLVPQKKFLEKLYCLSLWKGYNCLKNTEPLWAEVHFLSLGP